MNFAGLSLGDWLPVFGIFIMLMFINFKLGDIFDALHERNKIERDRHAHELRTRQEP